MNNIKAFISTFLTHPYFYGAKDVETTYDYHIKLIKLSLCFSLVMVFLYSFFSQQKEPFALKIEVDANGTPLSQYDLTAERDHGQIKKFAALALRQTFNLDSYGTHKGYVATVNYVNARYYKLSWDMMNLTEEEYQSGRIFDGETSFYLKGQELAAILVRSGLLRLLKEKEVKFWIEVQPNSLTITNTQICDSEFCLDPAKTWDIKAETKLFMVDLDGNTSTKVLPLKVSMRVIAVHRIVSPKHGLMIERLAASIPVEKKK